MAKKKTLLNQKYQVGILGLAGVLVLGAYFHKDIMGLVDKVLPKDKANGDAAVAGLGAVGFHKNGAHMGAIHANPKHMGLLSVDGKVRRTNPAHMGAIHMNPGHMGMMHGAHYGALGINM